MKAQINIDFEFSDLTDAITVETLRENLKQFNVDLKKDRPLIFSGDPKKDKKEIKKHIDAFNVVIDYFTK